MRLIRVLLVVACLGVWGSVGAGIAGAQEPDPEPTSPAESWGEVLTRIEALLEDGEHVRTVALTDATIAKIGSQMPTTETVKLHGDTIDSLAVALGEGAPTVARAGAYTGDPWDDTRIQLLAGLAIGLWVSTRLVRLLVPNA